METSTIVEQLDKNLSKLQNMCNHHKDYTYSDFVYVLGNINALVTLRDLVEPSDHMTLEDYRLVNCMRKINKWYAAWDTDRLFEEYHNIPEVIV